MAIKKVREQVQAAIDSNKYPEKPDSGKMGAEVIDVIDENFEELNYAINNFDEDIFDSVIWVKELWATGDDYPDIGGPLNYSVVWKVWRSELIDVTSYDIIIFEDLMNGVPKSNATRQLNAILVYADGVLVDYTQDGPSVNVYRISDYNATKVEVIIQAVSSSDTEFIKTVGTFRAIKEGVVPEPVQKRVTLCGDSLAGFTTYGFMYYLNNILRANQQEDLQLRIQGGEKSIGNLARAGGIGIRTAHDFIIPDSGNVYVNLESAWMKEDGNYYIGEPLFYSINEVSSIQIIFEGIEVNLLKEEKQIVGIAFYDNTDVFISSLELSGTVVAPANTAKYKFCVVNPSPRVPELSVNTVSVNIQTATNAGYIDSTGEYVADSNYLSSNFIAATAGDEFVFEYLAFATEYILERQADGTEYTINKGHIEFSKAQIDDKDNIHIWYTGQNAGYENEEDFASMLESAISNFSDEYVVLFTATTNTTSAMIRALTKRFSNKFLSLRNYGQSQYVIDGQKMGLIDPIYTADDWEDLVWPGADKIHYDAKTAYIFAVKTWNMMLDLGYVKGFKVFDDTYFV